MTDNAVRGVEWRQRNAHESQCPRLQFWDAGEFEAPCCCEAIVNDNAAEGPTQKEEEDIQIALGVTCGQWGNETAMYFRALRTLQRAFRRERKERERLCGEYAEQLKGFWAGICGECAAQKKLAEAAEADAARYFHCYDMKKDELTNMMGQRDALVERLRDIEEKSKSKETSC